MTNGKLNGIIKNPRTTERYLKKLSTNPKLTEKQVLLLLERKYKDSSIVFNLFLGYNKNPSIVKEIIVKTHSPSTLLIRRISDFLVVNPHRWTENEWQPVMDAFKKLISANEISKHSNLLYFSYNECENQHVVYSDDFDSDKEEYRAYHFFNY